MVLVYILYYVAIGILYTSIGRRTFDKKAYERGRRTVDQQDFDSQTKTVANVMIYCLTVWMWPFMAACNIIVLISKALRVILGKKGA